MLKTRNRGDVREPGKGGNPKQTIKPYKAFCTYKAVKTTMNDVHLNLIGQKVIITFL